MNRKATMIILFAALSLLNGFALHAMDTIQLRIRSATLTMSKPEITIGDVCDVRGGSPQLRNRISSLDLDVVAPEVKTEISQQQVLVRIALAGISRKSIKIDGPESIEIQLIANEHLQQRLESKIGVELGKQFGIAVADIRVRLLDQNVLEQLREQVETDNFDLMAFFSNQLPLGDKYVQVDISDAKGNRWSRKVRVQIVVLRDVFVTSGAVARGTVITASHVQSIKRPLMDSSVEIAGEDCVGCTAIRDIAPHQIVTTRHLSRQPVRNRTLVKRNDLVDVVLISGRLQVRIKNAKVMSSGGKGDTVRVLNTNSGKEVSAIVQDQSTVVIKN